MVVVSRIFHCALPIARERERDIKREHNKRKKREKREKVTQVSKSFFKTSRVGIVMVFVLRAQGYGMCPWEKGAVGEGVSVSKESVCCPNYLLLKLTMCHYSLIFPSTPNI